MYYIYSFPKPPTPIIIATFPIVSLVLRPLPRSLPPALLSLSAAATAATTTTPSSMALKAVHVADVPNLDQVRESPTFTLYSTRFPNGDSGRSAFKLPNKFLVIGHRGNGMNKLQSPDRRMKAIKENSILSFNAAAAFGVDFIEFDVQVTKDECPVIFHDDFVLSHENGSVFEKRIPELCLSEFMGYGPQREAGKAGKSLLRKTGHGKIVDWEVETEDCLCTLQETFERVDPSLGFNIELKFDDYIVYDHDYLLRVLQSVMQVVFDFANDRPIIFSSFHPDAARFVRQLQSTYPVYFLTNGGNEIYYDVRRNSLEEALKLCLEHGLQGIVSEVKGVFRNPEVVTKIKASNLSLLTYGQLNNVKESVYMQYLMGVDGVIVDLVEEITKAVSGYIKPSMEAGLEEGKGEGGEVRTEAKPQFSERELTFLLKLIPELIQL